MRISRIYVDHFGAPTGWYEQTTFDFCDPVTGEPTDSCINLENAGGKTSLLSYIFSCFDPRKDRWLQSLQSDKHSFRDYFARDGRPSFLITEWIMPSRTPGGSDYRLIVGQSVLIREVADRASESDRRFFAFDATERLRWEDLPVPGIAMVPIKTMQEFLSWSQQTARLNSKGDFFITQNQTEWMVHLEERRLIDLELLKMQVSFNSREGGSEDGFLSFSTETDLVARLLNLSMNQEQTTELRNMVGQAVDNLKSKPRLEEKLGQFKRLQQAMEPFTESALKLVSAKEALKSVNQQAVNASTAIRRRLVELETEIKNDNGAMSQFETIAKQATADAFSASSEHVAITGLVLQREEIIAEDELKQVSDLIIQDEAHLACLKAALLRREIDAIAASLRELEEQKNAITQELKPLEDEAANNGAMLRFALGTQLEKLDEKLGSLTSERESAEKLMFDLDAQIGLLSTRSGELQNEQGVINGKLEAAKKVYDSLISNDLLLPTDIDVDAAIDRLSQAIDELEARLEELKTRRAEKDAVLSDCRKRASEAQQEAKAATDRQGLVTKFLREHELAFESLQNSPLLMNLVQGHCDPRSLVLLGDLQKLIETTRSDISRKDIRLDQLSRDRESIEQTGLAGRNGDVDQVVQALSSAGVRSARAANTYLADLRRDADAARALVLSDPSRHLGVNVASDEWEKAVELVDGQLHLELTAPVTLAVASLEAGTPAKDRLVLRPLNDSAFNRDAAQVALSEFETTIELVNKERDELVQRDQQAQAVLGELKGFQFTYSHEKVVAAETELDRLKDQSETAAATHEQLTIEIEGIEGEVRAFGSEIEQLPRQILSLQHGKKQLGDYLEQWERPLQSSKQRVVEIAGRLSEIAAEAKAKGEAKAAALIDVQHLSGQESNLKTDRALRAIERQGIEKVNEDYDAGAEIERRGYTLDVLRSRHSDSMALLTAAEKDRLGLIGHQLESRRAEHDKAQQKYRQEFLHVDSETVESLVGLDVDHEIGHQSERLAKLTREKETKRTALSDAKAAIKSHWQNHEKVEPADDMYALADDDLRVAAVQRLKLAEQKAAERQTATEEADKLKSKISKSRQMLSGLNANLKNLDAAFDRKQLIAEEIELGDDVGEMVTGLISHIRIQEKAVSELRTQAEQSYQAVIRIVGKSDFIASEGQIAEIFASENLDRACADNEFITGMIADRVAALEGSLEGMVPDFERCVTEIYNQVSSATSMLKHATSISMPVGTPYVSGRPILKMSANLSGMSTDQRKSEIGQYLNRLIETSMIPKTGSEVITQCLLLFTPRQTFGLQILKMEQNIEFQYQPVNNMKKSGGQGTVIAMFLYMLVSHLRVDTQAKAKRGGGGPLLLDNPFANVQTRALIDAQRMLAKSLKIQLICLTANADPNIIEGFRRVLRLRKAGMQKYSGRTYIEMAKATFADGAVPA